MSETMEAPPQQGMPQQPAAKLIDLGSALKASPAKAQTKRVGIVPPAPHAPMDGVLPPKNADGFVFPANDGTSDTNVTNHGGTVAPGVAVHLIFWGSNWNAGDAGMRDQIVSAARNLIEGPYFSALGQYGLGGPTFRDVSTVTSPAPPATFDDSTIGDLVWNCIDANAFPEPDDSGGYNYYCVLMPPGTNYGAGSAQPPK